MAEQVYKRHTPLRYSFQQANPEPGDWEELVRWISGEFQKLEASSIASVLPGYGSIRINTQYIYNLTATPQLISPWDVADDLPIAVLTDAVTGNLTIDKDGQGVWQVNATTFWVAATKNTAYTLYFYINGVSQGSTTRTIGGTVDEFSISATAQLTLEAGDVLEVYASSVGNATATLDSSALTLTRIG